MDKTVDYAIVIGTTIVIFLFLVCGIGIVFSKGKDQVRPAVTERQRLAESQALNRNAPQQ